MLVCAEEWRAAGFNRQEPVVEVVRLGFFEAEVARPRTLARAVKVPIPGFGFQIFTWA
jgi:hypothetical protein